MLDLNVCTAFDTVNHKNFLQRQQHNIGISGIPLQWFKSYLLNRSQRIEVQRTLSENFNLKCGVSQVSCPLGPPLYIIYTQKSCLKSLNTILLMHIATLKIHSYISALEQLMDSHLRLMSLKQWKNVLRT